MSVAGGIAEPPYALRAATAADGGGPAFLHALATDPEGAFVAEAKGGALLGRGAAVAREGTLRVVELAVAETARGTGVGGALLGALRAFGRARGTSALEAEAPLAPGSLAFAAR